MQIGASTTIEVGREHHGDRLQLRDRDDAVLACRSDDVALVGEAEADPAAERRLDIGVAELRLGVLVHIIGLDQRGLRDDGRLLGVELLFGGEILLRQRLVALQVELGVVERGFVLRLLGNDLIERGLIGPRVDLRQQITGLDDVAFLEGDLDDLAVDTAFDSHRVEGLHRAEPGQQHREVGFSSLARPKPECPAPAAAAPPARRARRAGRQNSRRCPDRSRAR